MKQLLLLVLILISFTTTFAQPPYSFNYQGIARNDKGLPYTNRDINLRLSIRDSFPNGTIVYSEIRKVTTNSQGLFSCVIGSEGTITRFNYIWSVPWKAGKKFLQTEIDPAGSNSYTDLGTTQLQSVPFALVSDRAHSVDFPLTANYTGYATVMNLTNSGPGRTMTVSSAQNNAIEAYTESYSGGAAIKAITKFENSIAIAASAQGGGIGLSVLGGVQLFGPTMQPGNGKVLTSDAQGNATWKPLPAEPSAQTSFRVAGLKDNLNQTISHDKWTKVLFNQNTQYNLGNAFNTSAALFFPPENGLYNLNTQIYWFTHLKQCNARIMLLRNGVMYEIATDTQGDVSEENEKRCNKIILDYPLQKNDAVWVEVYYYVPTTPTRQISTAHNGTWFSARMIHKL